MCIYRHLICQVALQHKKGGHCCSSRDQAKKWDADWKMTSVLSILLTASGRQTLLTALYLLILCLPAARDKLGQASISQVSAAPEVQWAEWATASSQHTGHNIIVLNLQERQASIYSPACAAFAGQQSVWGFMEGLWRVHISLKMDP